MADHQQSSEAVAKAAAAAYSRKQIADSMAFIDEILPELAAAPDVRHEFLSLLSGLGKHGGDADAVGSRAAELLRGHPDVLRRFTAHVHMDAIAEQGLALTRPRRSRSRRWSESRQNPTAAAAAPPEAPPNVAAQALAFVKRVHETAGPVVHARFLAVLSEAQGSEDMLADEIYDRARRAFGPAHVGLLHAFATAWLPGEQEWKLQQQQQQEQARGPAARQRSRAGAAAVSSHAGMPDANKKSRADDDGNARRHDPATAIARRQRNRAAAASSHAAAAGMPDAKKPRTDDGGNGRQHDHVIAVLEVRNVKKRRSDDDGTAGRGLHRVGESSGGGAAAQGRDDDYDYDYAPRSRAKKPHSGNGEFSGSAAAARVLGTDAAGVHHAYSDNNDNKKPPRRRAAAIGGKSSRAGAAAAAGPERDDDEVRRFRQEWEFQTYYSKLVATSDRVTKLLRRARTRTTAHGDGGGGDRSLEALFPLPECREFLHNFYGVRWGEMRAALERGESRVPALEVIQRRLKTKEEEAVVEESRKRWRHDPVRVAQRFHGGLAMDTLDEECRRHQGGGGG